MMDDDIVLGSGLYMRNLTTGEVTRVSSEISELNIEPHPEPNPLKEIDFKAEVTLEFSFRTVSKKRCKKLLMGYGIPRNDAEFYSRLLGSCGMRTPGVIKSVVETCRRLTYEER